MLGRYLAIALAALLAVVIVTGASAAEDSSDTKRCGGYYACIELQPAQPGQWRYFVANPESPSP